MTLAEMQSRVEDRVAMTGDRSGVAFHAVPALEKAVGLVNELVEIVHVFHGGEMWDFYRTQSPEMKRVNAFLKGLGVEP